MRLISALTIVMILMLLGCSTGPTGTDLCRVYPLPVLKMHPEDVVSPDLRTWIASLVGQIDGVEVLVRCATW